MRLPHFNLIYKYSGNFSRETFDKNYANIRTLSGSKILIFGSGLSSMKLASWLSNCNCEVGIVSLSNRKVSNLPAGVIQVDVERVNNVLIEQDFVINLLSRRSDTDNYFSAERLSLLATDSFYISAGRGSTTDENALIELLNGGKIAGAALDVFSHEPLLPNSSLFQCRNLLMTPHVAAVSRDYWKLQTELFLNNLNNFASGHTMLGRVERL
jgi:phosphoglycerate dehydrogenase-like enzyme